MTDEKRTARIPRQGEGMRLDRFLVEVYPQFSRRKIQEAIKQGDVRLNGRPARPGTVVHEGDRLQLPLLDRAVEKVVTDRRKRERLREASAPPTEIVELYRDDDLLIVSKPAGVPVHGGAELGAVRTLLERLQDDVVRGFGLVHRLDIDTSGVIALVRGADLRAEVTKRFAAGDTAIEKGYEAIAEGVPEAEAGEIDLPLTRPGHGGTVRVDPREGKEARTRYQLLEAFHDASRLRLELLTGRTHQIRAHLGAIGHPLLVDPRYGRRKGWRLVDPRGKLDARLRRTPLHAARLVMPHPRSGAHIEATAPLPGDMRYALEVLRVDAARRRREGASGAS